MKIDNQAVAARLKEFGKEKFGQLKVLAELLGMSRQSLSTGYLTGRSLPGAEILYKLSNLGCDITWLLTGQAGTGGTGGASAPLSHRGSGAAQPPEGGLKVREGASFEGVLKGFNYPVVSSIGAGPHMPYDNIIEEYVPFPYKHRECVVLRVKGDSMIPLIQENDLVLVDLIKRPTAGDIVAVRMVAGEQYIKQLMVVENGKKLFHLYSMNLAYAIQAFAFEEVETVKKVVMILKDTDYKHE